MVVGSRMAFFVSGGCVWDMMGQCQEITETCVTACRFRGSDSSFIFVYIYVDVHKFGISKFVLSGGRIKSLLNSYWRSSWAASLGR
jgi:hypothetical protein